MLGRNAYIRKAEAILSDTDSYDLTEMTSETLEQTVSGELKETTTLRNLPAEVYKGLFPKDSRLPEFNGSPKPHKQEALLRPVVAAFNGPLTRTQG